MKEVRVDLKPPITYQSLMNAASTTFGLDEEYIQLLVNNVQVAYESNIKLLGLDVHPVVVYQLSTLNIIIGTISFPINFCLSYMCSSLCYHVIEALRSSGFQPPDLEYCLEVNGVRVEMNKKLKDVGCSDGSEVVVVSADGRSLDDYFCISEDPGDGEEVSQSEQVEQGAEDENRNSPTELSSEPPVELNTGMEPEVEPAVELNVGVEPSMEPAVELNVGVEPKMEPAVELNTGSEPVMEAAVELRTESKAENDENAERLTESRRRRRESRRRSVQSPTLPPPAELPQDIIACFSSLSSVLSGNEEALGSLSNIEGFVKEIQQNLMDYSQECQRIFQNMEEMHYENQMLRDMYNEIKPSTRDIPVNSPSWKRPNSYKNTEEVLELPDDVESLKKLVNEKYAVALMNERRYFQEKRQTQKYQVMLQTLSGDESSVNSLVSQYRTLSDRGEQLKEENMDLKEKIRKINEGISSRDDEIRQLTETIQLRENDVKRLEEMIRENEVRVERRKPMKGNREAVGEGDSPAAEQDTAKMEQLQNEKKAVETELQNSLMERETIARELQHVTEEKLVLENRLRDLRESNAQLQSELEGAREILQQLQERMKEKEQSGDVEELKARNEELERLRGSLEEQVEELKGKEEEMKSNLEALKSSVNEAMKREQELLSKNEKMEEENKSLQSLVDQLKKEIEEEEKREDLLEQQLNSIVEGIRSNMSGKKNRLVMTME